MRPKIFKTVIAICVLIGTTGMAQVRENGFIGPIKLEPTFVQEDLQKYVDEFVIEGYRRGLMLDDDIQKQLKYIVLADYLKYPVLGTFIPAVDGRGIIYLSTYTMMDVIIVRRVLFHELGHALVVHMEQPHVCESCNKIMSFRTPESFAYLSDYKVWSAELDEFFEWIKNNKKL